ncbi:related to transposase [Sporisorium reilianum f. sp. reilianum]|uniref:Related to transposase n=1 Tax=Sporisorium reilianum f. sp. reilianum TaxID=72559 RepID=A0A2N8UMT3_9BASI|nr:related to transposase [Sporisorium reilianum f. sp. reilianum]
MGMQTLLPDAEGALIDLIHQSACSGYPLTPVSIQDHANIVSHPVPGCLESVDVRCNWMQDFLLHHPSIRSCWSCCLENARLNAASKPSIQSWYQRFADIINQFGMSLTNVFNMDKTGFMFSQGGSEHVVVPAGNLASRFRAQPGTQELATIIKCIGSSGQVLPPLVITKGCIHTVGEHRSMEGIPTLWHFLKLTNGWTSNALAIKWLENVFNPNTTLSTSSAWHLLILDSHKSHISTEFLDAVWHWQIIPFLLPLHLMHLMQPLDVSIFSLLTAPYCCIVNDIARHVDANINKAQFATFYAQAWVKVLLQFAAQKAFSDTGMTINLDPKRVLHRLPSYDLAIPRMNATLNVMLNTFCQEPDLWDANRLKRMVIQAHEEVRARNLVLEAENKLLQQQEERISRITTKAKCKDRVGDWMVLSKDKMITRKYAECELVAKKPTIAVNQRKHHQKKCQREEEEVVAPPPAAADDGNDTSEDGNEALLTSPPTPSPPPTQRFLDELDDGEPLSAITDGDDNPFGFFNTLLQPGPSRTQR